MQQRNYQSTPRQKERFWGDQTAKAMSEVVGQRGEQNGRKANSFVTLGQSSGWGSLFILADPLDIFSFNLCGKIKGGSQWIKDVSQQTGTFFKIFAFLVSRNHRLDLLTWQQFYLSGQSPSVQDIVTIHCHFFFLQGRQDQGRLT